MALSMDKATKRIAGTNAIGLKYRSLSILTLRFRSDFTMIRDTDKIYFFSFNLDKLKHAGTHTNKKRLDCNLKLRF